MSLFENAATSGDQHGQIEVIEFDKGSDWTGQVTLNLIISGFFGKANFGLRLEKNPGDESSIFELRTKIIEIQTESEEEDETPKKERDTILQPKKKKKEGTKSDSTTTKGDPVWEIDEGDHKGEISDPSKPYDRGTPPDSTAVRIPWRK